MGATVKQLRNLKVVLVDADPAFTREWSRIFEADGHSVVCCNDLPSAYRAVAEGCDCLITALHIRGLSGLDLIRAANHPAGPVMILLTADPSPDIETQALAAGASCLFEKDVESALLRSTVEALCGAIYQPVMRYATGEFSVSTLRSAV
ncbi:MAG TPA: response regulator [Terriglobales bacterium]|nr:response regulator [Terriglobales bacterium]